MCNRPQAQRHLTWSAAERDLDLLALRALRITVIVSMSVHPDGDVSPKRKNSSLVRRGSSYFDEFELDKLAAAAAEEHNAMDENFYTQMAEYFKPSNMLIVLALTFVVQIVICLATLGLGMWGNGLINAVGVACACFGAV